MFADFIQCFSFKGVVVVSNDSRGAKVASATGHVHVALQRACEWAKENSWLTARGRYNALTPLCIQTGEWDLTWTKSQSGYCGKKKRKKETQRWPRRIETNCTVFVAAWNAWAAMGFDWVEIYPLWNSTMVTWIRKCRQRVQRHFGSAVRRLWNTVSSKIHDWESLASAAVPSPTLHGIHKVTAVPGIHQLIHSLKCRPHSSALLVLRSCLLCRRGNCLNWTSSGPTGIVLPNKGLPLPSNKCCEAHAGNVKPVPGEHKTGNNVIDSAICVTEWLLANADKWGTITHWGLEDQWKFRRDSLLGASDCGRATTLVASQPTGNRGGEQELPVRHPTCFINSLGVCFLVP